MLAAIALGSNLASGFGDPAATILEALRRLESLGAIAARSTLRETEPVGYRDQPAFVNGAALLDTKLAAPELMRELLTIENAMGRVRDGTVSKGPRSIDLDLLLYDGTVLSAPDLTLPHPAMHERLFVLEPLVEIAPTMLHPVFGLSVADLLQKLRERSNA